MADCAISDLSQFDTMQALFFIMILLFSQQGNERLPVLSHGSERNTGFTHGTKARPVFYSKVGQVSGL